MKGKMCKVGNKTRKVVYRSDRTDKPYMVLKPVDETVSRYRGVGRRMSSWGVFNALASNGMSHWFDSEAAKEFEKYLDFGSGKKRKKFKAEGLMLLTYEPSVLNLSDPTVERARLEIYERQLNLLDIYGWFFKQGRIWFIMAESKVDFHKI